MTEALQWCKARTMKPEKQSQRIVQVSRSRQGTWMKKVVAERQVWLGCDDTPGTLVIYSTGERWSVMPIS